MDTQTATLQHPHHDQRGWGFSKDCETCMASHAQQPRHLCGIKRCKAHPGAKSKAELQTINYIEGSAYGLQPRQGTAMHCTSCDAQRWHDAVEPYPLYEYRDTHTTVECTCCGRQRAVLNTELV